MARRKNEFEIGLSEKTSQDIVECLEKKHKMALSKIAKLARTTKAFLLKVKKGEAELTTRHLVNIKKKIPIFVSLGKYLKERLVAQYAEKGEEVPECLLVAHKALMKIFRASEKPTRSLQKDKRKK